MPHWPAAITRNPFRPSIALLTPTRRRLMKSILGDEIVFDELHEELGLRLTYRDVIILDADNEVYAVFNLTDNDLDEKANRDALEALLVEGLNN